MPCVGVSKRRAHTLEQVRETGSTHPSWWVC